jgi:hypothetical protein
MEPANSEQMMAKIATVGAREEIGLGIRSALIVSYDVPRAFFQCLPQSAVRKLDQLGLSIYYGLELGYMGRSKRTRMDVDLMVERWRKTVVGLVTAHDKDEADRQEAAIDECLTPILSAPIKQIREFYPKLLKALKTDPSVPFLVWRSYEVWIDRVISKTSDEDIKELKTDLARQIVDLVEGDVRDQLPEAMIRALQWRSAETLEEVKAVVERERAAGHKVRLKGRESCLFIEAGGSIDSPEVCVQL